MKIIRLRRGFSTNCSGANEYFPPDQQILPPPNIDGDAAVNSRWVTNPNAKVVFRWVTLMPDGGPPPMLRAALQKGSTDAGADGSPDGSTAATADHHDADLPPARPRDIGSNGLILLIVIFAVAALFGLERLTRLLRRRLGKGSHGEEG